MNKTYIISQGKHSSGFHFRPHISKKNLRYDVMFDKSSQYYHGDMDQYDINKLFGLSYGYHHNNSVRFGWRSMGNLTSKIEILGYCYVNGKRITEDGSNLFICMVDLNEFYTYSIIVMEDSYLLNVSQNGKTTGSLEIPHNNLPSWGYYLYPYFGGNRKAPHDIKIHFKK